MKSFASICFSNIRENPNYNSLCIFKGFFLNFLFKINNKRENL